MANTLIELNDTPSDYSGKALTFLRVNADENGISFSTAELNDLSDVQANGAYLPQTGQALIYSAAGVWRPTSLDIYSAGDGLNKSSLTLSVVAGVGGGLTSNSNGVYISDIADVAGTWGNSSYTPVFTVNSKGQITSVTPTLITATQATTITSPFVGNVLGTAGQISVVGGTGNNSNATLNLVATGVTAGVYGNSTTVPRITVDSYGRIQNVDSIAISGGAGGGDATLGFANIVVAGQTTVSADQLEDSVIFAGGTGVDITTAANADTVYFAANVEEIASGISLGDLADVATAGIANGQTIIWNAANSTFIPGNAIGGGGGISLTDLSVTTASPSGNGALSYNSGTGVFTFTPANIAAVTQSLSWNAATYVLSISSGNSVNLSVLKDSDTDAQTLSLNGNIITISGSNSSVNLTSALGNVAGNYGNSNVAAYLTANGYATQTYVNTANTNMKAYVDAGLANAAGNYGNANVAAYLSDNNYATQTYVTTQINNLTAGAPSALDTLAEIAHALNNSNATLATVAFTGNHSSLANRPSMSLASNTYLLYDGSNVDLSSVIGQQGVKGDTGNAGLSVSSGQIGLWGNLILTLTDNSNVDVGPVRGWKSGPCWVNDPIYSAVANRFIYENVGNVETIRVSPTSYDEIFYGDSNYNTWISSWTTTNANSAIKGTLVLDKTESYPPAGPIIFQVTSGVFHAGQDYAGTPQPWNDYWTIGVNHVDGDLADLGNVGLYSFTFIPSGEKGDPGLDGDGNAGISTATVAGNNNLIIGLVNGTYINAGNVKGPQGDTGATGNAGVGITSVSLVSSNLVLNYSNTSTQDVGNIRGPQGAAGTNGTNGVSVSSATVNGSGNLILTMSNASTIDAGNVRGAAGAAGIQLSNLSVTTNSASGNGSLTYSNVTGVFTFTPALGLSASGVTAGTYGNATTMPQFTVDTYGRITSISNVSISAGGPGDITGVTAGTGLSGGGASGDVTLSLATSGAAAGTYGNSTTVAQVTVDTYGRVTSISNVSIAGGAGTITSVTAGTGLTGGGSSGALTLNVGAGSGITVNADNIALTSGVVTAGTYGSSSLIPQITVDTYGRVTSVSNVSVSGGGGGGTSATIQRFKLNYNTSGQLASTANLTSGISGVTIDSAAGGDVTITFSSDFKYPPSSIMLYGYVYSSNKYVISNLETTMGLREMPGGGSSGSPTAFDGSTTPISIKLRLRETETGASRSFGTTTHAWIQMTMYD